MKKHDKYEGENKMISITKVVTKNFIMDIVAKFQNMLGLNIKGYETLVDKAMQQIKDELKLNGIVMDWYRFEITQFTNGALSITLYGEEK